MQDSEATMSSLHEIAALGVRLALDDFGTGYCSLGYLKRYPLHVLKVDRSFIAAAPDDPDSVAISRAVIGLGQSLGLAVVAEGVERPEQVAFLGAEGCQLVQGYWFSPPRSAAELQRMFDREHRFDELWALHPVTPGTTLNDPLPACLPG